MKSKRKGATKPQGGIFAAVDTWLDQKNADEAEREIGKVQKEIQNLFTLPLAVRWVEITSIRENWEQTIAFADQVSKLAPGSPMRGRALTFQAEALRQLGKAEEAEKLIGDGESEMCGLAMKLAEAGDFDKAKELLLVSMALHPAMELFAEANPLCCRILNRPEMN